MLQIDFRKIQSVFYVTFLEHGSIRELRDFQLMPVRFRADGLLAQKFKKNVVCYFFNIEKTLFIYIIRKRNAHWCCRAHIQLLNDTCASTSHRVVTED